jgi:hypothetical protein
LQSPGFAHHVGLGVSGHVALRVHGVPALGQHPPVFAHEDGAEGGVALLARLAGERHRPPEVVGISLVDACHGPVLLSSQAPMLRPRFDETQRT